MGKYQVHSIEEIQALADRLGMPLDKMRFFVGRNASEAKCFGIYREADGRVIVYKNKADGTRAVRYQGSDEAKAAQIFWDRLEEEIRIRQKGRDWWRHQEDLASMPGYEAEYSKQLRRRQKRKKSRRYILPVLISVTALLAGAVLAVLLKTNHTYPHNGYYQNQNDVFYYQSPSWYYWDDDSWQVYDRDVEDDWQDWQYSRYADDEAYFTDFKDSTYYVEPVHSSHDSDYDDDWSSDWDDSWDSSDDYDYDYGDWDSDDTDWDSDW